MRRGRLLSVMLSIAMAGVMLAGCGEDKQGSKKSDLKVGMVTDSGTIEDKSFNQGTWEGIVAAEEEFGIQHTYLQPTGETEADYLREIQNLYDSEYKFIVSPGFKFSKAIFTAQEKYPDAKFILIDGVPNNGEEGTAYAEKIGENNISILFAEHQSGFLAGLATALQIKDGDVGFVGGMEIPPVVKFNCGFQQGIDYANNNLDTNISMKKENFVYSGSFKDTSAGQAMAAQMYDRGVKVIFHAAGGTGAGVINEARERAKGGKESWVVGVDCDQYADGIYEGDLKDKNEKSVILTSAVKNLSVVTLDMIKTEIDGKLKGGELLIYDATNNGIGIPQNNPNLDEDVVKKVQEAFEKLKSGELKVKEEVDLLK